MANATHWRDGSLITQIDWSSNFGYRGRCAVVAHPHVYDHALFDIVCDGDRQVVCEVNVAAPTVSPVTELIPNIADQNLELRDLVSNFTKPVSDSMTKRMNRMERRLEQISDLVINRDGNVNSTSVNQAISNLQNNQKVIMESITHIKKIMMQLYETVHGDK